MVEADLVAWKIPQFVELLAEAGCNQVFMGVETVRQETLNATRKRQNKVRDYADMCALHHEFGIACHAGYILGFPTDTPQTIAEDVETLKESASTRCRSSFSHPSRDRRIISGSTWPESRWTKI